MDHEYDFKLSSLTEMMETEIVFPSTDYDEVLIKSSDVHRPGLQLAGFFDHFEPERIQLIGHMESSYMEKFPIYARMKKWEMLFKHKIPALIVCHDAGITNELLMAAEKYDISILSSPDRTTEVMSELIRIIKRAIAPRVTRHGVLVEVYGVGVLLIGESGVGKSEAAVELLKRGHRLIADDAVDIKAIDVNVIQGTAPDLIRHYMELRGIGVIDVRQIFGIGAVKDRQNIHLIVNLELWRDGAHYDRLGLNEDKINILGVDVATITIPVKPGRNLAVILEVAAMNQRQKFMGYNAAVELTKQINKHFDAKIM